ncbi:TraB/GumN family protein [Alteribacter natronophilus]|uniref:TraB/GumN family protein n=1 Tax=Alteribacter natronophilus TaxID=2583810 RepID=UPI00148718C4|nr:TraB/GumN family protein [Alteribacter natronophilus]
MKYLLGVVLLGLMSAGLSGCSEPTESKEKVFEDGNLESAVRETVGIEGDTELDEEHLAIVETLHAFERNIESLEGIEQLENLEELVIFGNEIEDLSPLLSLENLESVDIENNPLDLSVGSDAYRVVRTLTENDVFIYIDEERFTLDMEPSRGVFYEVEHGENTVYLLGSIHVGSEELYPLHDDIERAYESSDVTAFEIDFSSVDENEIGILAAQAGMLDQDESLEDYISEDEFKRLAFLLSPLGLNDPDVLSQMKPYFLQEALVALASMTAGYSPELGIDMHFIDRAEADEKEIIGLETVEDQLALADHLSLETQGMILSETLEEYDELGDELLELMSMWRMGDAEGITELRQPDADDYPEDYLAYYEALSDERDAAMAEKIEEFLNAEEGYNEGDTYFVVVGALHLVGENSIVDLLETRGYDVQQRANHPPLETDDMDEDE